MLGKPFHALTDFPTHPSLENNHEDETVRKLRIGLFGGKGPEQVLRKALPISEHDYGSGIPTDQDWRSADHRAQGHDGAPSWSETGNDRACPPQERTKNGQPGRKLAGADRPRAFEPTQVEASEGAPMRCLRPDIYPAPANERPDQDMLSEVSVSEGVNHKAICGVEFWFIAMRGALSALPTASGPWIWKPPAEVEETKQWEMF